MKHIYAVETKEELAEYQKFVHEIGPQLNEYIDFLKKEYKVVELPGAIVWANEEIATKLIRDIPVPAYTNEFRIVMTPSLETWRDIYLKQLDDVDDNKEHAGLVMRIREYYNHAIARNHVMKILGHELAHHSELFPEDFDTYFNNGIWFEEGMVEYISRRYFLSEEEFDAETKVNRQLVDLLKERYGNHSLEQFGETTYEGDYASIFFEYWRSFLAVKQIIEDYSGDIGAVFESYHKWAENNNGQTLVEWFDVEI